MKNTTKEMPYYLRAGFSCFWIPTDEPRRIQMEVHPLIEKIRLNSGKELEKKIRVWKCTGKTGDPEKPLLDLFQEEEENIVLFLYNYDWFLKKNKKLIQHIQDMSPFWASQGKAIVVVSSSHEVPEELRTEFTTLKLELPSEEDLDKIMNETIPEEHIPTDEEEKARVLSAAKTLTANEAVNVFALSIVENERLQPETILDYRKSSIERDGLLTVIEPTTTFADVVGYDQWKNFTMEMIQNPKSKGNLMIGPPGTGKTSLMKAVVGEMTGKKIGLIVHIGKLFSKWLGESDKLVDRVIDTICDLGNSIILLDEFEKQFAGSDAGQNSHEVTRRTSSRWLDFLQDRPEGINVFGTANTFIGIPPEFIRPGRFDCSPFFVDLPNDATKKKIFHHYMERMSIKDQRLPKTDKWSGAEVETCCHIAMVKETSLVNAAKFIRPIAITEAEKIQALRDWAETRTIKAEDIPGVSNEVKAPKRKIVSINR